MRARHWMRELFELKQASGKNSTWVEDGTLAADGIEGVDNRVEDTQASSPSLPLPS